MLKCESVSQSHKSEMWMQFTCEYGSQNRECESISHSHKSEMWKFFTWMWNLVTTPRRSTPHRWIWGILYKTNKYFRISESKSKIWNHIFKIWRIAWYYNIGSLAPICDNQNRDCESISQSHKSECEKWSRECDSHLRLPHAHIR